MAEMNSTMAGPIGDIPGILKERPLIGSLSSRKHLYIPSLDGIRAVAVMMVFLSHAGFGHIVPGGFGVTVFFFLSGYLITTLLREEHRQHQKINLRHFYFRRMLRIWPPLYLTLAIVAGFSFYGAFGLTKPESTPLLYQVLHLGNYYQIFGHGQSIPGTEILWSLAVEEHFYLVWPMLFACLYGRLSRQRFLLLLAGICLTVLAWRCTLVWYWSANIWRTYFATDTRIDSILFGCILGIWRNPSLDNTSKKRAWVLPILLIVSLTLLAATFVIRSPAFRETFRYSIQGLALMPMFYAAVKASHKIPFRWLNHPALKVVGVWSYSIYLSHFFLLHILAETVGRPSWNVAILAMITSACFAWSIQILIDRPLSVFRRRLRA